MDFWEVFSQIWGLVSLVYDCFRGLNDNATTLTKETGRLKRKREEVEDEVRAAELAGKRRRCNVDDWLQDVDEIVPEVESIQLEFERRTANPFSLYHLGKRIFEKIEVVKALQDKGDFDEVARSPCRPLMTEWQVPGQLEQQGTSQETLQEIEQALSDEEIGVVCVSGMGGIGKTTLMKKIYNRLVGTRDFDVVIWATVSKDLDLNAIQKKIGNVLKVEFRENEGMEERRNNLYARLRKKKYMLILDDLWEAFALDQVGIPQPNTENGCKIAITTRLVKVGNRMEADSIIRVKTLSIVEAWELFRNKTGDVVLLPEIQTLAKKVVRECGGLPLAIQTMGGVMRRKGQKELWQNALRALRARAAPEVPGMEREVFLPLKLSYDCLEDREIQSCFLYCSLYPEDYRIEIEDLVRYWAFEEGLIENVSSLDDAVNKGYGIIEKLRDACLLEDGPQGDTHVWMHDLLRDLAIWITSSSSSSCFKASNALVKAGEGLVQPPEEKMWEGAQRISLMCNHIRELQMTPRNCPDLVHLSLYQNLGLRTIHNSFFQLMPKLQILDLRKTAIKSLPPSLSQLVNLRVLDASRCSKLQDVPPLGHLKELQFLDLGGTGIESLPQGIGSLAKLRSLELSETKALATIPGDIISGLTSLEDLGLYSNEQMMSMEIWREVATLPRLTNLRILLPSLGAFAANDTKHPMWSRLSRFQVQFGHTDPSFNRDYRERTLIISNCEELPSVQKAFGGGLPTGFQQLKSIYICHCHKLRCIFSPGMLQHLQSLESLSVTYCEEIVEIVGGGPLPDIVILPKLKSVSFFGCDKLRCIFSSGMLQHLQSLESLSISYCKEIMDIVEGGPLLDTVTLPKLKSIYISGCHKLRCIFFSGMLQHLQSLESLIVYNCEEIVEIAEGGPLPDTVTLPKLKSIDIFGCHKLRCIFSSGILQHLQSLESLAVRNCKEIVEIVEGGPLPDTVILPKLKSFCISSCPKLRCIFSSSMLQHLHPLEWFTVSNCKEIVEIVEGGPLPDTALQRLSCMDLRKLPKLTAICSQQLVLTSMKEIQIYDCLELKKLPILCSGIQEIRKGKIKGAKEWWEGIEWGDEHSKSLYSTIYEETKAGDGVEEASEPPEPAKEGEATSKL